MRTQKAKRRVTLALNHEETEWRVSFVDRAPRQHKFAAAFPFPGKTREDVGNWITAQRDLRLVDPDELAPQPELKSTRDYFRASCSPGHASFEPFGAYADEIRLIESGLATADEIAQAMGAQIWPAQQAAA